MGLAQATRPQPPVADDFVRLRKSAEVGQFLPCAAQQRVTLNTEVNTALADAKLKARSVELRGSARFDH